MSQGPPITLAASRGPGWAKGPGLLHQSPYLSPQLYHRAANVLSLSPHDGQVSCVGERVTPGSSSSTRLNPATPHSRAYWAEGVSAGLESRPRHPLPTTAVEGAARPSCCEPCPCVYLFTLRSHAQGETSSPNTHFGSPVATCMSVRVVQNKFYLSLLYPELRTALCKPCLATLRMDAQRTQGAESKPGPFNVPESGGTSPPSRTHRGRMVLNSALTPSLLSLVVRNSISSQRIRKSL